MQLRQDLRFWAALGLSAACLVGCGRGLPLQASVAKPSVTKAKSAEGIAQAIRAGLLASWSTLDKDKSQFLEPNEYSKDQDFQQDDLNHDGKISLPEMISQSTRPEEIKKFQDEIKKLFIQHDKNNSSFIEVEELAGFLNQDQKTPAQIQDTMLAFDLNQDGKLSLSEAEDAKGALGMILVYVLLDAFGNGKVKWEVKPAPQGTR